MSISVVVSHLTLLLGGIPLTLELVGLALLLGLFLGCLTALVRMSRIPGLSQLAAIYVYVMRGTPLLVQIFLIYYGLGEVDFIRQSALWPLLREEFWCAILALALNSGAYTSEAIRGSIEAIDHRQLDAAVAFGMNRRTRLWHIVIPQALRQFLPAYGNECISIVKASALASTITLMEVTGMARNLASQTYTPIETFTAAGIIYLALNLIIALLLGHAESKTAGGGYAR
ncbi:MAG: ABC transporter permease subunit [Proteobacteria bacterium]|nr:ABC transporter permease subunit [Pseudomonadota bacterium]